MESTIPADIMDAFFGGRFEPRMDHSPDQEENRRRGARGAYEVQDRGHETPCWISLAVNSAGYGPYREFYYREYGEVPRQPTRDGGTKPKILHHRCEVKACVRPDHLLPVSDKEHGTLHSMLVTGL